MTTDFHPRSLTCDCTSCMRDDDPAPAEWSITDFTVGYTEPVDEAPQGAESEVVHTTGFHRYEVQVEYVLHRRIGNVRWDKVETRTEQRVAAFISRR